MLGRWGGEHGVVGGVRHGLRGIEAEGGTVLFFRMALRREGVRPVHTSFAVHGVMRR